MLDRGCVIRAYVVTSLLPAIAAMSGCAPSGLVGRQADVQPSGKTLTAFTSDREAESYLRNLLVEQAARAAAAQRARERAACQTSIITTRLSTDSGAGRAGIGALVYGTVTEMPSGKPVTAASVSLPSLTLGTTTAAEGRFAIAISPEKLAHAESLDVLVRRIGYSQCRGVITVRRGDALDIRFWVSPAAVRLSEAVSMSTLAEAVNEQITNTQHAGVDEGDIVKLAGRYLVVLRRGRLFTIDVGRSAADHETLRPVAEVNAYGPDVSPARTWYDEMLVDGDRVLVVGYSYERGGTEVGLFRLDEYGQLHYEDTYQLRSNDYYSSRNYASRLVNHQLTFYAPLYLSGDTSRLRAILPAARRWRGDRDGDFRPIAAAARIYRMPFDTVPDGPLALHTVTRCNVQTPHLDCQATVVIGPAGNVAYVAPTAVYVWAVDGRRSDTARSAVTSTSLLYRIPLDGATPQAIRVSGSPLDQLSFLEADGYLNVVVRSFGWGDAMFAAEHGVRGAALLRIPLSDFGDGRTAAPRSRYRVLPLDSSQKATTFQNRFVGDWLLYGGGNGWWEATDTSSAVYAVRLSGGDVTRLAVPHGVDRIDALGRDAIVIGSHGPDLHFTGVRLADDPALVQHFVLPNAAQGELRTHGFFYRPTDESTGILGLPVRASDRPGWIHLVKGSAGVLYLRNARQQFTELGVLDARDLASADRVTDDGCQASCVDWYGNARPIFLRGRVFALLGYELVEGSVDGDRLRETRRVDFAPAMRR